MASSQSLFEHEGERRAKQQAPLADRLRPQSFDEFERRFDVRYAFQRPKIKIALDDVCIVGVQPIREFFLSFVESIRC